MPVPAPASAGSPWLRPVFCTAVGLVGNCLLTAGKIVVGVLAGSAALVADGFHSLADVLSDIGILFALKAAGRPPDANHPYGHHSFETLGAVVVAAFMLLTAGLIGWDAVRSWIAGELRHPEPLALGAALVSVAVKEVMARYTLLVGRRHNSPALLANGEMHRTDAISSVAAAIGIAGAMVRWPVLDNVAALVIAVFIARMGWNLLHENVMVLMDTMPDPALVEAIRGRAAAVPAVQEIRDLRVRQRGSWYLADLRIAVHPELSLGAAHDVAHAVEDQVRDGVGNVARVFVHVEPGRRDADPAPAPGHP
ncbi:MAG: cation diffusion facilitator family transporter [Candidatus Krumholzibacteriia bacterium]